MTVTDVQVKIIYLNNNNEVTDSLLFISSYFPDCLLTLVPLTCRNSALTPSNINYNNHRSQVCQLKLETNVMRTDYGSELSEDYIKSNSGHFVGLKSPNIYQI